MMLKQALLVLCAIALVHTEPPLPQYGVPFNNNAIGNGYNNYNTGNIGPGANNGFKASTATYEGLGHDYNGANDHGEPKAYEFGYQVKDDYTGTNYNRQEQSDGNQVTGSYRVALPDGRTQIVTYYADWKTGFHADVRYEGEAQYPQPNNYNNNHIYNGAYNYNQNGNQHQGFASSQYQGYQNYNNFNGNPQFVAPNAQYGAPVNPIAINNQYAALSSNYVTPAYDNYDSNQNYNQNTNHHNYNSAGDSYSNSGYGNKLKSSSYGAP